MFPLSKLIFSGTLLTTSSGIGIFLIPYLFFKKNDKYLSSFLKISNSSYDSKDKDLFEKSESEKLEKLNLSYEDMKKAKENARILQKLKNELMIELFLNVLKVEEILLNIYKQHEDILRRMQDNNSKIVNRTEQHSKLFSDIKYLDYSLSLLMQTREMFWNQGKFLNKFICFIENGDKKIEEQKCQESEEKWFSKQSNQGGAVMLPQIMV